MGKFMPRLIKLHRSKNHRMIAGVMGGIAEYLGWSPNMVRIAFVIISSLSAAVPGILIYLVLWLIMPNATPNSYATNLVQYDRKPL
ncbi:putative stress-responsive transcriptional regulator [Moraxella catarrhalis]|nr:putative stress-responsive transcriptional regulator [Moraxella catarrhalis]OAV08620.1 putative stress-responsive transcriptional regulator [Moraxella catarrhalis]OAV09846.1 putative stress-responsive transcriptional regulator [Moraxella catarrhalis]OAV12166.1 putative stress-responsive transcriptional regulator [Moraxella catarrhalis]OAV14184.1 putative stress-responsive transcriptional regulator [Moraxella catarrhalis]